MRGLSPVAASGGHSSSRCAGLSLSQPLLLRSTGSRRTGSVVVAHGPSCCAACGIFPDQGSNPCPLHWQADSQPLRHQGSPITSVLTDVCLLPILTHVCTQIYTFLFFFFLNTVPTIYLFIYFYKFTYFILFIFGCFASLLLRAGFL